MAGRHMIQEDAYRLYREGNFSRQVDDIAYAQQRQENEGYTRLRQQANRIDPSNVPGHVLADLGRQVLGKGRTPKEAIDEYRQSAKPKPVTSIEWLNMRIEEVCKKGAL